MPPQAGMLSAVDVQGRTAVYDLPERTVHVWTVDVQDGEEYVERARHLLSAEEQGRAAKYRFRRLMSRFTLARAALRTLLGGYLEVPAADVSLDYGPAGKPRLADAGSCLEFNVSESNGLALFAFTRHCPLGVDIERERPLEEVTSLISQCFSAEECRELLALPSSKLLSSFFACWTRKEAYIKAVGHGLSIPLDSFCVTVRPGEPARLLQTGPGEDSKAWSLHSFTPAPGYHGALAYRDSERPLTIQPLLPVRDLLLR